MDLLQRELVAGLSALEVGLAVVGLLVVVGGLRRWLGGDGETSRHNIAARCQACGWSGDVSAFTRQCPLCRGDVVQRPDPEAPNGRAPRP